MGALSRHVPRLRLTSGFAGSPFYPSTTIYHSFLDAHASVSSSQSAQAAPRRTRRQPIHDGADVECLCVYPGRYDPALAGEIGPDQALDASDHQCRTVQ